MLCSTDTENIGHPIEANGVFVIVERERMKMELSDEPSCK